MAKGDINFDPKNARVHDKRNKTLISKSLKKLGAGRSIVVDNDNFIIAGNGVFEQAQKLGIKHRVIESDGSELIIVKRTDLSFEDLNRKELAIVDNSASDASAFNYEVFEDDYFEDVPFEEWIPDDGLNQKEYGTTFDLRKGDRLPFQQITFTFSDTQASEIRAAIEIMKETRGFKSAKFDNANSNGNALYSIIMKWARRKIAK